MTACKSPKRKENLKSHHFTPLNVAVCFHYFSFKNLEHLDYYCDYKTFAVSYVCKLI